LNFIYWFTQIYAGLQPKFI